MLDYQIRPCQPQDLARLVELCEQHARHEQAPFVKEGKDAMLQQALFGPAPKLHCWVVAVGEAVVGYASFTFDFSTWDAQPYLHLDCLYLEPGYRSKGIGEEMLNRLGALGCEKGCVNLQWQTPTFNERAIRFYQRMGARGKEKIRFTHGLMEYKA